MNPMESQSPRRRRFRYSLRGLLLMVTAFAVLLGYEEYCTRREARAVLALERMQGSVTYKQIGPAWLRRLAGDRYLQRVGRADIYAETIDDAAPVLTTFGRLGEVRVLITKWPNPSRRAQDVGPGLAALRAALPDVRLQNYLLSRNPLSGHTTRLNTSRLGFQPLRVLGGEVFSQNADVEKWTRGRAVWTGMPPGERIARITRGRFLRVLFKNADLRPGSAARDAAAVLLVDGDHVVDGKNWDVPSTDDLIHVVCEDLNADGRLDVGVHYRGLLALPPLEPRNLPNDSRVWLDAFTITESGFVSLFDDASKSDDVTTADDR